MYTVGTIPTLRSWEAGGKAMGPMTFFCRDTMSDADKTREPKHFVTFAPGLFTTTSSSERGESFN